MIDELRNNIETEIEMLREISNYSRMLDYASAQDAKLLSLTIESLRSGMKLINNSIPALLSNVQTVKDLPSVKVEGENDQKKSIKTNLSENKFEVKKPDLENVEFKGEKTDIKVILDSKDREKFLKELSI